MTKTCSSCKQEFPLDSFYASANHKDGLDYFCKTCRKLLLDLSRVGKRVAEWHPGRRKSLAEYQQQYEGLQAAYEARTGRPYVPAGKVTAGIARSQRERDRARIDELQARVAELEAQVAAIKTVMTPLS